MKYLLSFFFFSMVSTLFAQPYHELDSGLSRGYALYYKGDYDEAGKAYFSALKRAQEEGNKRLEAEAFRLLGEVNRASANRPYAIKYLNQAESIFSSIQDEYGVASTKNRKAAVYFELGDSLNYIKYLLSSLKISRDKGFKDIEYNSLTILGAVQYVKARDYPGAIETLTQAVRIAFEIEKIEDLPYMYNNLARLYQEINDLDSAEYYGLEALRIGEENNIRSYIANSCGRLSLIYAAKGEFQKAYQFERRYTMILDTLGDESRDKVVAELVEKYQTERQLEALARQENQLKYAVFAGIFLLLILSVMLVMFLNLRKQRIKMAEVNVALAEANEVKSKLLSVLSHDLRSPVAALHSSLEIILEGGVPEEVQKELLSELNVRVHYTGQLIDNLLVWIKSQLSGV
ncbi:MAG: hypothetical protein LPK45_02175, partial [Bacteroidota bacterium]|nr:hypothetical protein [Bacteroidota bacterium]MDX5429841.1 hypothetical protein [Bacteroidota bacterium]MDX5468620.1 hypothetical protein [Bacteroidota bacterium]